MAKLTKNAVDKALRAMHGNISAAARALSVTRHAIQERLAKDPELQEFVREARESMADDAETALAAAIIEGEPWAIKYALSCLRGDVYAERTILAGDKANPLHLHHSGKIEHGPPTIQAEDIAYAEELARAAEAGVAGAGIHPDGGQEPLDRGRDPGDGKNAERK